MNQRDAKRDVCRAVARIIDAHRDQGAEWLATDQWGVDLDEDDLDRIDQAAAELAAELHRRGGTLVPHPRKVYCPECRCDVSDHLDAPVCPFCGIA